MARDQFRGDAAGVGPDPSLRGGLTRMSSMRGFKVADGDVDIRGWEVRTMSGREIGEVDDLLIDERRGEVVMIDIDLKDSDEHVSMAIRGVQIDRTRHCVIVDSGDVRDARALLGGPEGDRAATDVDAGRPLYREEPADDVRTVEARDDFTEEVVIERRPVVEEVVVRRKIVDTGTDPGDVA